MGSEEKFIKAIKELRKIEIKKNFDQTIDLIINLKNFNIKKDAFNIFIQLPNKIKDKKIAGFLEKDSELIKTIKKDGFDRYKDKKDMKKLIKEYDFFIANAKLMPAIATTFGRILGPVGKMPSPQLGILISEDEEAIKKIIDKINLSIRIRLKEPSIKVGIGKESLSNEEIVKNALIVYNKILDNLPRKKDNVRDIKLKFTMSKPVDVEI